MKKLSIAVLGVLACVSLAACSGGEDTKVIGGDVNNTTVSTVNEVSEVQNTDASSQNEAGYVFNYNGTDVVIDAEAAPIVESLGAPVNYYEAASCAFNGLDKMYTYNSFEVDTYPMEDVDYISGVILKDDAVSTKEGISIGNTRQDMIDMYGAEYQDEDGMCVYRSGSMKLCFIIDGDNIISIKYLTTILDE